MRCLEVMAGTGTASRSPSNPRLKTDDETARLSGSLIRHGLAA